MDPREFLFEIHETEKACEKTEKIYPVELTTQARSEILFSSSTNLRQHFHVPGYGSVK